ncbi:uracil permease [Leuconostoc mesenteroides P45]|uniref:solute carrier family 23 protein n=1 Tax=Leuconostoc mesenteroides TaxID=1245 RepID=UPI000505F8DA|nr:solute carrier family 23 protein [Leuconostoc mesenteroides]KGB50743.1 uracil permease [Leuconostoc mesenteroides P45]
MMTPKHNRIMDHGLAGIQHVFVSNVWLDPIYVAAAAGLSLNLSTNLVNTIFIVSGLVTLTQATKLAKLPIVQGPSAAFDALMINAGKAGQLATASGSILLSALIVFLLSVTGLINKLIKLLTPAITGTLIFLVGISLSGFTLSEFLGGYPGDKGFSSPTTLILSITTATIVILLSIFGKGFWKRFSFLIALIVGDILAVSLGVVDYSVLSTKSWFGMPHLLPYGSLKFNWVMFLTFFVAYVVAVVEALGVYQAAGDTLKENISPRRIQNGLIGESAGSMFSPLFGGFPTTAFAQNVGILNLTGNVSRIPVIIAGILFVVLGFVPKIGAFLAITPSPVIGGIFLPAATTLILTGFNILKRAPDNNENNMIIGLSIILAIALPNYATGWSGVTGELLSNSILVGALSAIILQFALVNLPRMIKNIRGSHD